MNMGRKFHRFTILFFTLLAVLAWSAANAAPDAPGLSATSSGHGKVRLTVTAGASGAPSGFQVRWMTAADFAANGNVWPSTPVPGMGVAHYVGVGTLNTWGAPSVDFRLAPQQALDVEIGDTFDETGVSGTTGSELGGGTTYVFSAIADGTTADDPSPASLTVLDETSVQGTNCTYTFGYWKTHPAVWPSTSFALGSVTYDQQQLLAILNQAVQGNGLVSLAHQLIAAKLNNFNGADLSGAIADADALIGALVVPPVGGGWLDPSVTSSLTQALDDYNNGVTGPGHCGETPTHVRTWGTLKAKYR